ncbi:MAG: DUF2007 domain-containing protein [Opitutae bacterium]|nr:DUF2007 domain-containing protein [Opitutae bacterium]
MKTVAVYSTPAEAHVLVARLMSADIPATIRDEYTVTFNWLLSNAIGGVKVEVPDENYATAREIVALPPSEEGLLRCPFCGSDATHVRVVSVFGAVCMLLKIPIPMTRAIVDCHRCKKTHNVPLRGRMSEKMAQTTAMTPPSSPPPPVPSADF